MRLAGGGADALTARLRFEGMLACADLHPPGLPPAAQLFVREIRVPASVALPLSSGAARPPPAWEAAFVDELERARRRAARPAIGAVPASADAVLFADEAELLACLAHDALEGTRWRAGGGAPQ